MNNEDQYVYLDIEADGLDPKNIWVVVCKHRGKHEVFTDAGTFKKYAEELTEATWVMHNGIGYDVPVLSSLWDHTWRPESIRDTLVLSRLWDPSLDGGHSLRAWGGRLGFPKDDHSDWSQLSDEMISYCKRDVDVTERLHQKLMNECLKDFSEESIELEHQVAWIIKEQETNGWLLDVRKANDLVAFFKQKMLDIESDLQKTFPPIVEERWSDKTGKRLKDKVTVFNVGSRKQIAERLVTRGAVFKETTDKGTPIVDESTLKANLHVPEAAQVLEYLTLQKRYSQISSWLDHVDERTNRVHGRVNSNGAVTGRMTHSSPNVAQVPASSAEYGVVCRECWTVPEGKKLVGFDASGLELRMLAHYMNDEDYTNVLLTGDIHTHNQVAAGLETRSQAKTFIYALL